MLDKAKYGVGDQATTGRTGPRVGPVGVIPGGKHNSTDYRLPGGPISQSQLCDRVSSNHAGDPCEPDVQRKQRCLDDVSIMYELIPNNI